MSNFSSFVGIIAGVISIALAIPTFLEHKNKGLSKTTLFFMSTVIVVLLGAGVYFSTSATITPHSPTIPFASNVTVTPTATPSPTATPIPVPTPKVIPEDVNIDCLNCVGNYAITLKVNTITIDYANQQTIMKYTLKNIGTVSCTVIFNKLEFQDDNGTIFKAQNVGQSIVDIAVGNPFIASSTFDLLPRPNTHYLLSTSISCTNTIEFKTQDFVFS